jgi:hypothetical protein
MKQAVRLAGAELKGSRHVCAFFHTPDELYQTLLPFIKEGIEEGQKAFHIIDPERRADHFQRLRTAGIDADAVEQAGQLEVLPWQDAYLRGGHFDQDAMLALLESVLQKGESEGYELTRLMANMEWALEDRPGVDDLVEYETRLNFILPHYDDAVI